MTSAPVEPADLLDLKLLPAWVKEPADAGNYEHYAGEDARPQPLKQRDRRDRRSSPKRQRPTSKAARPDPRGFNKLGSDRRPRRHQERKQFPRRESPSATPRPPVPEITIRFLPYAAPFENVVAQIRSGSVAYSLYALARLFLEKPERYEVRLIAKPESPFYRLGDNGALSLHREFLERNAFRFAQSEFYKVDIAESEPIKGNFSNVARCRLSGTLLGPTNHHNYQSQLRGLYEHRFSRRMSFPDYQRQIEIVNDAELIDRWKGEARKVTTYTTLREQVPSTFSSASDAERHFRSHYLDGLITTSREAIIGGVASRHLPDKILNRAVEEAWVRETRSPSGMMQELAGQLRQNGLNVFRHRRGMLFVSPIRTRNFVHEHAAVSAAVNAILETLAGTAAINRKQLFEKLIGDMTAEGAESRKLAFAADLRWLINEGYVIEFNDGSLDLPRGKNKREAVAPHGSTTERTEQTSAASTEQTFALAIWRGPYSLTIFSEGPASSPS